MYESDVIINDMETNASQCYVLGLSDYCDGTHYDDSLGLSCDCKLPDHLNSEFVWNTCTCNFHQQNSRNDDIKQNLNYDC